MDENKCDDIEIVYDDCDDIVRILRCSCGMYLLDLPSHGTMVRLDSSQIKKLTIVLNRIKIDKNSPGPPPKNCMN